MGEGDDDLVGAAAAGGRQRGVRRVGGEGGADPGRAGAEEPRGVGLGTGGAGEEQGEDVEEDHLERTRNPGAIPLLAHKGEGAHGGRQGGWDWVHVVLYLT
jgi:hypothetical protein